jgi:hypothetical protein
MPCYVVTGLCIPLCEEKDAPFSREIQTHVRECQRAVEQACVQAHLPFLVVFVA